MILLWLLNILNSETHWERLRTLSNTQVISSVLIGYRNESLFFQLMRIVSGASNGLSHLHSNGIIHSNIKASNVMIDGDFTPKASFHCKILASDWSTNENWNQLRHIENNHVEKNPDSENVRWWALELFYDSIVSFAIFSEFIIFDKVYKYLGSELWAVYKRNRYLEFWCFDVGDSHFGKDAVFKYCYQRYPASCENG